MKNDLDQFTEDLGSSIVELLKSLVRRPSRTTADSHIAITTEVGEWFFRNGVPFQLLADGNETSGILVKIPGEDARNALLLNAPLDTADFGSLRNWTKHAHAADQEGDWLFGRGAADSKSGVAILMHLARSYVHDIRRPNRDIVIYFDLDEHSGKFGGMRRLLKCTDFSISEAIVAYPGMDKIVDGARGFLRLKFRVSGRTGHTGSRIPNNSNAIQKAAHLCIEFAESHFVPSDPEDEIGPRLTVTRIKGGGAYSTVPDVCYLYVDIRISPSVSEPLLFNRIQLALKRIDDLFPGGHPSTFEVVSSAKPYRLRTDAPLLLAMRQAVTEIIGTDIPAAMCGPSNTANLLSAQGIDAICGFGARYRNIHGPDEAVFVPDLVPVYQVYYNVVQRLAFGVAGS